MRKLLRMGLLAFSLCLLSCRPSDGELRGLLEKTAQSDLNDILQELKVKGIDSLAAAEPYFEVAQFVMFQGDTARVFQAMAEVHYFYLKKLRLYQARKYRYKSTVGTWDRYEVELKHRM